MFVCFEGIDGAGKSTQARMLLERLQAEGTAAELVADPGTTHIGAAIRKILLENEAPISPAAQMLLFSAARAELAEYIRAKLAQNIVIICDRWLLSTLVYQGEINRLPIDLIVDIFRETSGVCPDICFLLDLPPAAAIGRIGKPRDRYEKRCAADRQKMREAYRAHALYRPHAAIVHEIQASKSPQETHEEIYSLFCSGGTNSAGYAVFNERI